MVIYISHQKAAALAKKHDVPLADRGDEYLVGSVGAKLGKALDTYFGKQYYIKLYGDSSALAKGKEEFNLYNYPEGGD